MKAPWIFLMLTVLIRAEEDPSPGVPEAHREGSSAVADHQDELSADVQQLAIEQTVPQVIELLKEVRALQSFRSVDDLIFQIRSDVEICRSAAKSAF